jgi:hypothetical protein
MPKAILTFKLPEEQYYYDAASNGTAWKSIVGELALLLRSKLKYGHTYKTVDEALEDVKQVLWQECQDANLDPWSD